jgi:hypothetical protein
LRTLSTHKKHKNHQIKIFEQTKSRFLLFRKRTVSFKKFEIQDASLVSISPREEQSLLGQSLPDNLHYRSELDQNMLQQAENKQTLLQL